MGLKLESDWSNRSNGAAERSPFSLGSAATPLAVGELTAALKAVVDELFCDVCVVGEISNLTQPQSGHAYLTLKDENAQLSAAIWKTVASKIRFQLKNGLQVVCRGRLEVYPPHGKYQLIVTQIEPMGVGALELAFRQLQEKLAREGLFAPERKKPLPAFVRRIGVATSATGAAIRDFLNILGRRTKRIDVVLAPTKVQGDGAAQDVVRALELLNSQRETLRLDAIALIRGGGSVEDLWTFNEEPVVRAVAASLLPIATGIGHEIDVSLCDLAADLHALTPSDAAAKLAPEDAAFFQLLDERTVRIRRGIERALADANERLRQAARARIFSAPETILTENRAKFLLELEARLTRNVGETLKNAGNQTSEAAAKLEALSPLAVLGRGYSLTKKASDGRILRRAADVPIGETIETRLSEGTIRSVVVDDIS